MLLPAQQGIPADELRLGSTPYWPPSQTILKVEARLVEVGVVVRDSRGHTVGGLTRDDFEIEDSGKKREIAAFSAEQRPPSNAAPATPAAGSTAPPAPSQSSPILQRPPRFLGLVFDDFALTAADLPVTRTAARRFLKQGLQSDDRVGIFFVSKGLVLPFTADIARLEDAIDHLNFAAREASLPTCPSLTAYEAMTIAERQDSSLLPVKVEEAQSCGYCARRGDRNCPDKVRLLAQTAWEQVRDTSARTLSVLNGIVAYMAKMPGRRVMVLASSGFLSRSLEREREDIIDRALHAEVIINSLDAKGLYTQDLGLQNSPTSLRSLQYRQSVGTRPQWESNDSMAILSAGTGGLFFHNNNDLDLGFRELGLVPEFSYSLGFSPAGAADNRYHALKVRLKTPGHHEVQSRPGYYSTNQPAKPPAPERPIDKKVLTSDTLEEVPGRVIAASAQTAGGEAALRVTLHLDLQHMRFTTLAGVRTLQVRFIAALFDEHSTFVVGKECEAAFSLKDDTFNRLAEGLDASLTLLASPGKYRLRAVAQESIEGKLIASSLPVEIPAAR
jgi:VWFA-related protein